MELKRSDMTEEIVWSFKCPECECYSSTSEDPDYSEDAECEHCGAIIEIVGDE